MEKPNREHKTKKKSSVFGIISFLTKTQNLDNNIIHFNI